MTRQIIKSAAETGFSKVLKDASPPSINQQIQNGGSTGLLWEIRRHQLRLRILVHITTVHRRNNFQRKAQHSAHRSAGQGCSASAFSVPGKLFNRRRHHYVFNGIIVLGPVRRLEEVASHHHTATFKIRTATKTTIAVDPIYFELETFSSSWNAS